MTIKNRELLPIGTRVKPYTKGAKREGTVIGHSDDGERMEIKWDDQNWSGFFMIMEVRKV